MPWQRHVADIALEVDPATGRLAYRTIVIIVPRQSGKTTLKLFVKVQRALAFGGRQRITETAQTRRDAVEKWIDEELPLLDESSLSRLYRPRKVNGSEALLWRNGSISGFVATTKKAGHGKTLDLAIVDEAFAQKDLRLEQSLRPPMITREQPQLWAISTGGDEESVWLRRLAQSGRRAVELDRGHGIAYFEWSADPSSDPGDPATWWSCMPALGYTVTEEAVRDEFEVMDLDEFRRAYLNIWPIDIEDDSEATVIDIAEWALRADPESAPIDPVAFAIDVTPDQSWAAIGAAGTRYDGLRHVELIDHRPGTRWVVDRLLDLRSRWSPSAIALCPTTQAGALLPDLEAAGIEVTLINQREYALGCAGFKADITGTTHGDIAEAPDDVDIKVPRLVHTDQAQLNDAVEGATERRIGTSELWYWNRRDTTVDISPLVAVTIAYQAHLTAEQPGPVFAW